MDDKLQNLRIPYRKENNYTNDIVDERLTFAEEEAGRELKHLRQFSFDPEITEGNIENFAGAAQIPVGLAGPLHVNGEHSKGKYTIPLATTEGTLVASYNRGMKILNHSGGAQATVVHEAMQRAPVFIFDDARKGKEFVGWLRKHFNEIKAQAESTTSVGKLVDIDPYQSNNFVFVRFNYSTGDAAGQNMSGRATAAACGWIMQEFSGIQNFYLESNFATDKKDSSINRLRTRGRRVTAEATIDGELLRQTLRTAPQRIAKHFNVGGIGSFMSGANNNGAHSPNGIAAMFIATGQDVANLAESSSAILYTEALENDQLYISITLPSLIVATHGGGTGLPTQSECLSILGCHGKGQANKLAEIVASVALAGEVSLMGAITADEWVQSHEKLGRNK